MRTHPLASPLPRRLAALTLTLSLAATLGAAPPANARDALTLRVNDAWAAPSGLAAVVIRTYASKPISQGQVCFLTRRSRTAQLDKAASGHPFAAIEAVQVFAQRRDGVSFATLDTASGGQTIVIQFSSESGTINESDGPLAVIYFRVRSSVTPGERYEIAIDAANTAVLDDRGQPIRVAPRAGELRIRHPADPYEAEAEDDRVAPGRRAEIGLETYEPVAMASGQVGLTYDPAIAAGRPKVKLDRKYGRRRFSVDRDTPGLVFVTFRSPDASWNLVPGQIVSVLLPTSKRVAPGTRSRVAIDPSLTFFVGPDGRLLPFEFEDGMIRFTGGGGGGGGGGDGDDDDSDDDDSDDG